MYTKTAEETIALGKKIGERLRAGDILALEGTLAAGKTTLTKGIAKALGVAEGVTSPSFTIISEYAGRLPLYHMDVYRLDSCEDFINTGAEELLYGKGICVIEWAEKVREVLPDTAIVIRIDATADGGRHIALANWNYGDLL
ncbi:MAG: tRNA (adenosine(37)-N6)-threonylcarbamoyltransferase complex ATPase subunit type 1 TsaE [Treponema sp.]|nr:tRNA (adenosine(37)-N6)-threonylcarbamoyltransferase complex ATPase subunit type 1 TsaE [Treponema sp.]